MAATLAFQPKIHTCTGNFPFKGTAGMGLFHSYYVADIELDVQHSLFYTFHRTDVRYIVTGFTDLLDDIHTML